MRAGRNIILRSRTWAEPHRRTERGIQSQSRISMRFRTLGWIVVNKRARGTWYQRVEQDATVARLGANICLGIRLDCATGANS